MERKGTTNVPVSGVDDKRSITATFSITLDKQFLPMQLIYKGKANQSLPKVNFPQKFSLSVNEKHYSNEKESLKFIEEVILRTFKTSAKKLGLNHKKHSSFMTFFVDKLLTGFSMLLKKTISLQAKYRQI